MANQNGRGEHRFIYKLGNRVKDLSLHRPRDFETGLSFSLIAPISAYFTYEIQTLVNAGYRVSIDGGQIAMNLWENRPYIEPNIGDTILYPDEHVTVYYPDYDYWLKWYEADQANLFTQEQSAQLITFYTLRYKKV